MTFTSLSFNWLLWMRKSYNYEVILIFFHIVLGNSFNPDPDSRSSGFGSEWRFLAGSGFNWIRIRNTAITVSWPIDGHLCCRSKKKPTHLDLFPPQNDKVLRSPHHETHKLEKNTPCKNWPKQTIHFIFKK